MWGRAHSRRENGRGVQAHRVRVVQFGYGAVPHCQVAAARGGGGRHGEDEVSGVLDVEL